MHLGPQLLGCGSFPVQNTECVRAFVTHRGRLDGATILWGVKISRVFKGEGGAATKIRTRDLMITNQLLYQLSYSGILPKRHL